MDGPLKKVQGTSKGASVQTVEWTRGCIGEIMVHFIAYANEAGGTMPLMKLKLHQVQARQMPPSFFRNQLAAAANPFKCFVKNFKSSCLHRVGIKSQNNNYDDTTLLSCFNVEPFY